MKRTATATITNSKAKGLTKKSKQENDCNTGHVLPVTWIATEPGPHKRWWWYIGFCAVMLWLMIFLILLREWFMLACVVAATIAILVTYTRASRQWTYHIDERTLTVNKQTLQLEDYHAFTTQVAQVGLDDTQPVVVLLLPKWRLGLHSQIALPENADETTKVLNAFKEVLPFDEAKGYLAGLRFLDRVAHWLRLT
jgi:uncharacterized membrane protein